MYFYSSCYWQFSISNRMFPYRTLRFNSRCFRETLTSDRFILLFFLNWLSSTFLISSAASVWAKLFVKCVKRREEKRYVPLRAHMWKKKWVMVIIWINDIKKYCYLATVCGCQTPISLVKVSYICLLPLWVGPLFNILSLFTWTQICIGVPSWRLS